ncbi:hypothetical protein OU5_5782 [Pseudomonas mandelii JR-1]|uniref:Uncharacterized protein n=1 Tax=Pseudomonas mandelii JR-1 TaxID=1147786 RepID=A0A024EJU6_9PSED|nr:hypothetical protein OU5_5782 [Pseudomonas mandelii JR-1]
MSEDKRHGGTPADWLLLAVVFCRSQACRRRRPQVRLRRQAWLLQKAASPHIAVWRGEVTQFK